MLEQIPDFQTSIVSNKDDARDKNIFYLAYGSNLSSKTFRGVRGIKPISQQNVHCPSLTLTFDLPGVPYMEPCFANTRYSSPAPPPQEGTDYHKVRWTKGVVGVVYEVTREDFQTIIATEGGGSSYQSISVPCHPLPPNISEVPEVPEKESFIAHTLYSPPRPDGLSRPDRNYAQPSSRYLGLLTSGAAEHHLPDEYREYLAQIRPYTITSMRQKIGKALLLAMWAPPLLAMVSFTKVVADDKGMAPKWYTTCMDFLFRGMWASYDGFYRKLYGDGERTVEGEQRSLIVQAEEDMMPLYVDEKVKELQDVLERRMA